LLALNKRAGRVPRRPAEDTTPYMTVKPLQRVDQEEPDAKKGGKPTFKGGQAGGDAVSRAAIGPRRGSRSSATGAATRRGCAWAREVFDQVDKGRWPFHDRAFPKVRRQRLDDDVTKLVIGAA